MKNVFRVFYLTAILAFLRLTAEEIPLTCFNLPVEKLEIDKNYLLELEDPFHRHVNLLKPIYQLWKSDDQELKYFWNFLEEKESILAAEYPALYNDSYHLLWLDTPEKRAPYETTFKNQGKSLIAWANDTRLEDGKWMYVLMNNRIYTSKEKKYQIHHSSLSGGAPVDSAGTLNIENGRITNIAFVSGHYKPRVEHGFAMLNHLIECGLDLQGVQITYCLRGPGTLIKKNTTAKQFLSCEIDLDYEAGEMFFYPIDHLEYYADERIKLFLTRNWELYAGSGTLEQDNPLCVGKGPFIAIVSLYLSHGEVTRISFNKCLDLPSDVEKMQLMMRELEKLDLDFSKIIFRVVKDHERILMSYKEFMSQIG